ncbi:MAG: acylphosphatase [Candidatus Omnitrophota bacterium]|nr:MAG: acylphosphatase [Candidatus Omnitrophota bacterium]
MQKRVHAFYSGIVQGVGFRFTARYLAGKYKVNGWVKNTADGRVELEIEGDADNVDKVLKGLRQELGRYITDASYKELPFSGEYEDFQINF